MCSNVLSSLSSVMQNNRIRASFVSVRLANTTNLKRNENRIGVVINEFVAYTVHPETKRFPLLGHKRYVNSLPIQFGSHFRRVRHISAIHQPKSGRHSCSERYAVVDKCKGRWTRHVFPLCSGRSSCNSDMYARDKKCLTLEYFYCL